MQVQSLIDLLKAEPRKTANRGEPVPIDRLRKSIFTIGGERELLALSAGHGIDRISAAALVPQLRNVLADVSCPATATADRVLLAAEIVVAHARRTNVIGSRVARASHQHGARSRLIDGPFAARHGFLRLEMCIRQKRVNKSPSIRPTWNHDVKSEGDGVGSIQVQKSS